MNSLPSDLLEDIQEIRKLKRHDEKTYFRRYFQEIFPHVFQVVQARMRSGTYWDGYKDIKETYGGLIQTVGDSPEPLVLSILLVLPRHVCLIHTPETKYHAGIIKQQVRQRLEICPQFILRCVDSSDPKQVYRVVKEQWEEWKPMGMPIAIDVTGGKKSMVSGASLAVGFLDVDILYIDNEGYDSDGRRPVDGAEYLSKLPNPMQVFGEIDRARAVELFKTHNYQGASRIFQKLSRIDSDDAMPDNGYALLSEAYHNWDNLEMIPAYNRMTALCDLLKKPHAFSKPPLLTEYVEILQTQQYILRCLTQIFRESITPGVQGKELLRGDDGLQKTICLIFSLYHNARRREQQQKYDMGALLLYRILELMEQRRLAKKGVDTAKARFSKQFLDQFTSKSRKELQWYRNRQISLWAGYRILSELSDPITHGLDLQQLQEQVKSRNVSIFAHGFRAISTEEYQTFRAFVEDIVQRFCTIEEIPYDALERECAFIQPFPSPSHNT